MDERHEAALAMAGRLAGVTFHGGSHGNMHALCEALAGAPFVGTVEACEALRDRLADVLGHCPDSNATCPDGNGTCPIRAGSSEVRAGSSGGGRDAVATRERQAVADDGVARSDDGVPPVTSDLRLAMCQWGWVEGFKVTVSELPPSLDAEPFLTIRGSRFTNLCDAIDALHASLEDENGRLRAGRDRMAEELARVMAECDGLRDELEAEREESLAGRGIAGELREWIDAHEPDEDGVWTLGGKAIGELREMADRIDREHVHLMRHQSLYMLRSCMHCIEGRVKEPCQQEGEEADRSCATCRYVMTERGAAWETRYCGYMHDGERQPRQLSTHLTSSDKPDPVHRMCCSHWRKEVKQ